MSNDAPCSRACGHFGPCVPSSSGSRADADALFAAMLEADGVEWPERWTEQDAENLRWVARQVAARLHRVIAPPRDDVSFLVAPDHTLTYVVGERNGKKVPVLYKWEADAPDPADFPERENRAPWQGGPQ